MNIVPFAAIVASQFASPVRNPVGTDAKANAAAGSSALSSATGRLQPLRSSLLSLLLPLWLSLWLSLGMQPALALQEVDLYQVRLGVDSDAASERASKAAAGLTEVYRRITGDRDVLERYPSLQRQLSTAATALLSYRYSEAAAGANSARFILTLSYAPNQVREHLRRAGAPFWQAQRPLLDVLLLQSDNGAIALLERSNAPASSRQLSQLGQQLGLPLRLPGERGAVANLSQTRQLWAASDAEIVAKLRSLSAESLLFGQLQEQGQGRWQGRWTFLFDNLVEQRTLTAASQAELLEAGLQLAQTQFASQLAGRLAGSSGAAGSSSRELIRIDGLSSVERYFAAMQLLNSVEALRGYTIRSFDNGSLAIETQSGLSSRAIARLLSSSGKLQADSSGATLRFRWTGR